MLSFKAKPYLNVSVLILPVSAGDTRLPGAEVLPLRVGASVPAAPINLNIGLVSFSPPPRMMALVAVHPVLLVYVPYLDCGCPLLNELKSPLKSPEGVGVGVGSGVLPPSALSLTLSTHHVA